LVIALGAGSGPGAFDQVLHFGHCF
jgi:hypothetical protein